MQELLSFQSGGCHLAIELRSVQEVVRAASLSSPPLHSDQLEGLLNLRGQMVPVIALKHFLDIEPQELQTGHFLIIIEDGSQRTFAIRSETETQIVAADVTNAVQDSDTAVQGHVKIDFQIASVLNPDVLSVNN